MTRDIVRQQGKLLEDFQNRSKPYLLPVEQIFAPVEFLSSSKKRLERNSTKTPIHVLVDQIYSDQIQNLIRFQWQFIYSTGANDLLQKTVCSDFGSLPFEKY